jgi:hypothetical protein
MDENGSIATCSYTVTVELRQHVENPGAKSLRDEHRKCKKLRSEQVVFLVQ